MARGGLFGAEHGTHGDAAGERLGQRGDVGPDAVVLVGEPLAGAAEAGLNLIDEQESAGGVAEGAARGEELLADRVDATLALDGLDADGAEFAAVAGGELLLEVVDVVEGDELDAGDQGIEGLAVLGFVGGRDRAHGAAMEAMLEREDLGSDGATLGAEEFGVDAGELERRLPGLGARVAEEDAIEAA